MQQPPSDDGERSQSARRLDTMFKTSPSFLCMLLGPEFVFEAANERYLHLVGVQTDPTRLKQALINLAGNAVKVTERGGVTLTIKAESTGGGARLTARRPHRPRRLLRPLLGRAGNVHILRDHQGPGRRGRRSRAL